MSGHDIAAIVLAGGRGTRMGGVDKAQVLLDGKPLISHVLDNLDAARVTVVTPFDLGGLLPSHVEVVAEQPRFSGPLSGIAAGLRAAEPFTAVLGVDAPYAARLLPRLAEALTPEADVALIVDAEGYRQPLCALWRTASLARSLDGLDTANQPIKLLFGPDVVVREVPGTGEETDADTPAELEALGQLEFDH